WRFTPSSYSSLAGSYRITNSTPVADPNRKFIYTASPDGRMHKLSVASGAEARGWPVRVTLLPQREKLGTSLNFSRGLVLTGNGAFDGKHNWGDSALMLTRNAGGLLRNWTPRNQASLESGDVDLGSTAPALIGGYAVQGGKDGKLRLLSLSRLGGRLGATGGELQTVTAPGGAEVFAAPAVSGRRLFVATSGVLDIFRLP